MVLPTGASAEEGDASAAAPAGHGEHQGRVWQLVPASGCTGRTPGLSSSSSPSPDRSALTSPAGSTAGLQVPTRPLHIAQLPGTWVGMRQPAGPAAG